MKEILDDLEYLSSKYNITILFAVESGSRLWRIDSKDSDYDVRFVYKRDTKDYLRIHPYKDVIEYTKNDRDYSGFDIYKFIRLLNSSNPTTIEWLMSDIIYIDDGYSKEHLRNIIIDDFNPISLYHHYRSMCKNNYLNYLKSEKLMTYKKYLYAMRGLISAEYVRQYNKIPPIRFEETLDRISIDKSISDKLKEIIDIKKSGDEKDYVSHIFLFEDYIEKFLEDKPEVLNRRFIKTHLLQDYIYKILKV